MTLNISSGKISRAVKTVIYGTEGIGKSTLASRFPDPLFIDVEGGTAQMDVRRIEAPKNWTELLNDVREVSANPEVCGTLVLDTADRAEGLLTEYICRKYNQPSIEAFGYGKGYTYLGEEWQRLMDAFDGCIAAGINVTVIAHAKQRKIEQPDQIGAYDHWEMKLSRQVAPLLKEWADLLLFLNYKTYVVTTDSNTKKAQGGKRVMYSSHNPVYDAKNRHGLPEEMELSFDPLAGIFAKSEIRNKKSEISSYETNGALPRGAGGQSGSGGSGALPRGTGGQFPSAGASGTVPESPLQRLRELMAEAGIEEYQVREIASAKKGMDPEMPLSEYPENFISGWCIKYFDKIVSMIREQGKSER